MDGGIGYVDFNRMVIALIFVLSLILLGMYLVKRFGKGWGLQHIPMNKRRMQILESISLGPKQRIIIVKRDDKEHVLIVGHDSATVLETDISKNAAIETSQ